MINLFALKTKDNSVAKFKAEVLAQKKLFDISQSSIYSDEAIILISNNRDKKNPMLKTNRNIIISECFLSNSKQLITKYKLDPKLSKNELLLYLYKKNGANFVQDLEGQFSIIIYDKQTKNIFASTDHFGINPLYYTVQQGNNFLISSEIKAFKNLSFFKKALNYKRVYDYLCTLVSAPEITFYENVFKLKKANTIQLDSKFNFNIKKYYELIAKDNEFRDYYDCVDQFSEIFRETIKNFDQEAHEYSSIMSGGLDSTSITSLLSDENDNLKSFSSVFSSPDINLSTSNEDAYVKEVIKEKNINHEFINLKNTGPFTFLLEYENQLDMPLYNSNLYVMDPILKKAKISGSKYIFDGLDGDVVVSHGYDELSQLARSFKFSSFFSAYRKTCSIMGKKSNSMNAFKTFFLKTYLSPKILEPYRRFKNNFLYEELNILRLNKKLHPKDMYKLINDNFGYDRGKYFEPKKSHINTINSNIWEMTFSHVYETRSVREITTLMPFFSKRIVEFCLSVDSSYKLKDGYDRAYFRDAMKSYVSSTILNKTIKADMSPMGVNDFLLRKKDLMDALLVDDEFTKIIDKEKIVKYFFNESAIDDNRKVLPIYDLIALQMWIKNENLDFEHEKLIQFM